ncbi:MAG: class I SAM-dependent methyltransferase [Gammaproteobacteria bacterium]|nr:class I SAM-dependent methyltransferase [Gammaproteobacteria bacterium]
MKQNVYQRPNKPRYITVNKRGRVAEKPRDTVAEPIVVDGFTECHVTPLDVAERMVEYLGHYGDKLTLDPQAGTGNLIQALYDSGHSRYELTAIERHAGLCAHVRKRFKDDQFIDPINECFLEYAEKAVNKIEFPRIIMNPPFRKVKQHFKAALSLLGPGGHSHCVMVALVPITFDHEEAETMEVLPNDTFPTAKVNTKIIRIERY